MYKYIIIGIIVLILLCIIWIISIYNKLVKLRNQVKDQWSQVDVQLKSRFDLIPNIVETVKGYASHEKQTFEDVVKARNNALKATTAKEEIKADNELTESLNKLFALSEAYPLLKSDANFKELQTSLKEVEEKIAFSRQFYNDTVLKYQNAIEVFPNVFVAKLFGFKQEQFFEAKENEKENIKVKF